MLDKYEIAVNDSNKARMEQDDYVLKLQNKVSQHQYMQKKTDRNVKYERYNAEAAPYWNDLSNTIKRIKDAGGARSFDQWITSMGNIFKLAEELGKAMRKSHFYEQLFNFIGEKTGISGYRPSDKIKEMPIKLDFTVEINEEGHLRTNATVDGMDMDGIPKKVMDMGLVLWAEEHGYHINNGRFFDKDDNIMTQEIFDNLNADPTADNTLKAYLKKHYLQANEVTAPSPLSTNLSPPAA